jgi:hypothetical protein
MRQESNEFILARLANLSNTAEGPTLPPRVTSGERVPTVNAPFISRVTGFTGGTQFSLIFDEPAGSNTYAVYYKLESPTTVNISQFTGPFTAFGAPVTINVLAAAGQKVTFYIQTILPSGMSSPITESPTCTSITL